MPRKPCGRLVGVTGLKISCEYPRMKGKQQCEWHWLLKQPADVQAAYAARRRERADIATNLAYRARVAPTEWPEGERWCSGCQGFVPLFYCSGSRCKAHDSGAAHAARVEKLYGITPQDYDRLFQLQGGRCAICGRRPQTKRLAVDHDHATGAVRGLLCASNENGCNRAVVANLEQAVDSGLDAARRAVAYFEDPPYARMSSGRRWEQIKVHAAALPPQQPPPF
jgi:hypothetical protein